MTAWTSVFTNSGEMLILYKSLKLLEFYKSSIAKKLCVFIHGKVCSSCETNARCITNVGWLCRVLQIAGSSSWHARYTVLTYLQTMVFYNLFTFMSDQKAVNGVSALVIRLLEDEQLEVRIKHLFTTVSNECKAKKVTMSV